MLSDEEKEAIEWLKRDNLDNTFAEILLNLIEKQSKEIEELKKPKYIINFETNEITKLTNDFVSKNKIKSKIEELDIEIQCCEYADDDLEEYKQDIEKEKARLLRDKAILQSLLGKE